MKAYRVPPLITDIVHTALASVDGMEFSHAESCPSCGGPLAGYDRKKKKFVTLAEEDGQERIISVMVKRFRCRHCGGLCYADEPFYPGSRIGSPVIDLFRSLSAMMPPSRAARVIAAMGIVVDRTTWKNYTGSPASGLPVVDVFGMRLPLCIVQLSDIAVRGEPGRPDPAGVIAACRNPSHDKS